MRKFKLLLLSLVLVLCNIAPVMASDATVDEVNTLYRDSSMVTSSYNEVVERTITAVNKNDVEILIMALSPSYGNVTVKYEGTTVFGQDITPLDWETVQGDNVTMYRCMVDLYAPVAGWQYSSFTVSYYLSDNENVTMIAVGQYTTDKYNKYYKSGSSDTSSSSSIEESTSDTGTVDLPDSSTTTELPKLGKAKIKMFVIDCYDRPFIVFNDGFEHHEIEIYNASTKKRVKKDTWSLDYYNLSCNKMEKNPGIYYARVRGYAYTSGKTVYGNWSDKKYAISTATVKEKSKNTYKNNSMTLSWKKVKGAKSYEVYFSTKENKGWKKIGSTKGTSYKLGSSQLSHKKGYYWIRSVTKVKGKTLKSTSKSRKYYYVYNYSY